MRIGRGIMGLIGVTVFLVLGAAIAGVLLLPDSGPVDVLAGFFDPAVAAVTSGPQGGQHAAIPAGVLNGNLLAPVGVAAMMFVAFGVFLAILFGAIKGVMGMAGMRGR